VRCKTSCPFSEGEGERKLKLEKRGGADQLKNSALTLTLSQRERGLWYALTLTLSQRERGLWYALTLTLSQRERGHGAT